MMDDTNVLQPLDRVTAPAGFEDRVLAELSLRRRMRPQVRRARMFRLALSSAAAGILVTFVVLNLFVFNQGAKSVEGIQAAAAAGRDSIPVTEKVDYGREVRSSSPGPRTIYLLEQVSNVSNVSTRY